MKNGLYNVAKFPQQMKPFSLMDVYNQPPSSLDSILKLSFKSTKFIFSWLTLRKIFQIKINIFCREQVGWLVEPTFTPVPSS